jgi:hypothetical protein
MDQPDLTRLIESARLHRMTAVELEKQRRSFAFGNANIENERVTRAVVDEAAERMTRRAAS